MTTYTEAVIDRFVKTANERLDLPPDIHGTPFERSVWDVLRTVRVGAVITYAALARRIGQPDALRAVANACTNSPLALAIPGRKVVRTNDAAFNLFGRRRDRTRRSRTNAR